MECAQRGDEYGGGGTESWEARGKAGLGFESWDEGGGKGGVSSQVCHKKQ